MNLKFQRTYLVFRERDPDVWVRMGEETVQSTRTLDDADVCELVVRSYMNKSHNAGGKFAVVPKKTWDLVQARSVSAKVSKVSA